MHLYKILYKVIDNDPKGENGGTRYQYTITQNRKIVDEFELTIIDIINNTSNSQKVNEYLLANIQISKDIELENKEKEKLLKSSKEDNLKDKLSTIDKKLINDIKKYCIDHHQDVIEKYKAGNEKIINSLVGKVLKNVTSAIDPPILILILKDL